MNAPAIIPICAVETRNTRKKIPFGIIAFFKTKVAGSRLLKAHQFSECADADFAIDFGYILLMKILLYYFPALA